MADKSKSRFKKQPQSLNDRHYRFLQQLSTPRPTSTPSFTLTEEEEKNPEEAMGLTEVPPFCKPSYADSIPQFSGITDFDSPIQEKEKSSNILSDGLIQLEKAASEAQESDNCVSHISQTADFGCSKEEKPLKVKIEGKRRLCKVTSQDNDGNEERNANHIEESVESDHAEFLDVSESFSMLLPASERNDEISAPCCTSKESKPSFNPVEEKEEKGPAVVVTEEEEKEPWKVKIEGRRRLCKVLSRDNEDAVRRACTYEENVELDDFDFVGTYDSITTPLPSKNISESAKNDGASEIRDILNDLSSRLEFLSMDKKRVPRATESVKAPSDLIKFEEIGEEKRFSAPEYGSAGSSFSCTSDRSDSSLDVGKNVAEGDSVVQSYQRDVTQCKSHKIESINAVYGVKVNKGLETKTSGCKMGNENSMGQSLFGCSSEEQWNSKPEIVKIMDMPQNSSKHDGRVKSFDTGRRGRKPGSWRGYTMSEISNDVDDDECVILSSQQAGTEEVRQGRKHNIHDEDYNEADLVDVSDDSDHAVIGDENPIIMTGPKGTYKLPGRIAKMLYPHQRDGLKWLWSLHCKGKGGILGDDMGLGKTMQICGFLAGLFSSNLIKRALVVAPKTLLPHWIKELSAVGLSDKTREYFGTCLKTRQYELQYILQDKGVLLTTYDIVRNNTRSLKGEFYFNDASDEDDVIWDYMILDEGHLIKNPSTQRAKSLLEIPSAHRIIISGTPIQNNLKELWALFNFCCPELLGDNKWFKQRYECPILHGNDKNASDRDKRIGSAVAKELRERIQPYFLRRLKSEVFKEDNISNAAKLSRKNEIIVWLKLTSCQRQLYEAFLKSELVLSAFDGSPLAALTILKKICDHPLILTKRAAEDVLEGMDSILNPQDVGVAEKLARHIADVAEKDDFRENHDNISCKISFILSLLDNLIPDGHNVLIFSQTRKMLNLIQDSLVSVGYDFLRIDGTTKASDRVKIVNDFQEGNRAPIFLLTAQVGGLGLTLTKADRVIVVDPAWNPSTDNQSVDRAYRIGQKNDVIVYRLMTCGTIEEKIYRKQIFKGGLFRTATEHKEQTRYFSQQDLRDIFSLPKDGFDVSPTQHQLHAEHGQQLIMDESLKSHVKFLETLNIAGVSHHSLLFSKTVSTEAERQEEEINRRRATTFVGSSSSSSSSECVVDGAEYAFRPKDVKLSKKVSSPDSSDKLTESEIKARINRLSQMVSNVAMVSRLPDRGEKLRKQIDDLNVQLVKIKMHEGDRQVIDLDDMSGKLRKVLHL